MSPSTIARYNWDPRKTAISSYTSTKMAEMVSKGGFMSVYLYRASCFLVLLFLTSAWGKQRGCVMLYNVSSSGIHTPRKPSPQLAQWAHDQTFKAFTYPLRVLSFTFLSSFTVEIDLLSLSEDWFALSSAFHKWHHKVRTPFCLASVI